MKNFTKTVISALCALTLFTMPFSVTASEVAQKKGEPKETVQFLYPDGSNVQFASEALSNDHNFIDENGEQITLPEELNSISSFAACSHIPFTHRTVSVAMHIRNNSTFVCAVSTGTGIECGGCQGLIRMVTPFKFAYNHYH